MFYRPWQIGKFHQETVKTLRQTLNLPALVCSVLASRGYDTPEKAQSVCGKGDTLSNPMLLSGMQQAVERIHTAIQENERILVFGDYDVDGVTATALLYIWLEAAGADVYYKLPNREEEGYGLNPSVVHLAQRKGVQLIITVDNGISAVAAVDAANEIGIDVVVTDHHLPQKELPKAVAIVDPLLPGDKSPCKSLSGAGVAFKLVCALEQVNPEDMLLFYSDLAAIGTVADIMQMTGENRRLVKAGLDLLHDTDRPGLAALMKTSGVNTNEITSEKISFALAPRLNAAGRMDNANLALQLLLSDEEDAAQELAQALEEKNTERQKIEQEITKQVLANIRADESYQEDRVLVVWGENYHSGVVGIVASRVVEQMGKPTILISVDEKGEGKGSGRSVDGFSLYNAIDSCAALLLRHGGHAFAAGLSIRKENLPQFRKEINAWANENYPVMEAAPLRVDAAITLGRISINDVAALETLAPFGNGNPSPLFLIQDAKIDEVYPVSEGKHTRLRVVQNGASLHVVWFGKSPQTLCYGQGDDVDVVVALSVFEGKNGSMISARVKDVRPAGLAETYLEQVQWVDVFSRNGTLSESQRKAICPAREDTVALYRTLMAQHGVKTEDLRPLFAKLGAENAGKALVSMQALQQLGLLCVQDGAWQIVPTAEKKDLDAAPVLQKLRG